MSKTAMDLTATRSPLTDQALTGEVSLLHGRTESSGEFPR
jgi:hypothetical protein